MKSYGQFCPLAQALEVVGERWTLLVIRELLCGSRRFSDIQKGVPLMSRSVLAQRLKSMCDAGVVERAGPDYRLTDAGQELGPIIIECGNWGARWARRKLENEDVDVALLMWDVRRRIDARSVPREPVLVQIEFRGAPRGKERFFLDFKGGEIDLCLSNPGRAVDLRVSTTPKAMAEVWLGYIPFAAALSAGAIRIEGPRKLALDFPGWLQLSVFAAVGARAKAASKASATGPDGPGARS